MKKALAVLAAWLALGAYMPGQEGISTGFCADIDPIMRVVKAAERSTEEANLVVQEVFAGPECAVATIRVRLVERLYAAKDADGARVEVWSIAPVGADDSRLFYMWMFPALDPSSDFRHGV